MLYNIPERCSLMLVFDTQLSIMLVFFVYGLAFFSMGVALTLETGRSPKLAERRVLRPLAVFGILHGSHEWLEIFLLQSSWLGSPFPEWVSWMRVFWLAFSFIPLIVFGILGLKPTPRKTKLLDIYLGALLLLLYGIVSFVLVRNNPAQADSLARYLLAVPGAILAALALNLRFRQFITEGRREMAWRFQWAAVGFGVYGVSQIFVPDSGLFLSPYINASFFLQLTGFPIQAVRATAAIMITLSLIRAIQLAESERERQLLAAQKERLEAMERVQQELVEREALRAELLRHIVLAQEEERGRIARELHDETAQILTAFTLDLATLRRQLKKPESVEIFERLQALSRQMSQGIYHLVHDLRPAMLDDLGLVHALQYLIDQARKRSNLEIKLDVSGSRQRLDPLVETVLFRVAQEATNNITRHANTPCADIRLMYLDDRVKLQVQDEGAGFDPQIEQAPPRGWGLAGMRERAESVGGRLAIHSSPGRGTLVELEIPISGVGMPQGKELSDGKQ